MNSELDLVQCYKSKWEINLAIHAILKPTSVASSTVVRLSYDARQKLSTNRQQSKRTTCNDFSVSYKSVANWCILTSWHWPTTSSTRIRQHVLCNVMIRSVRCSWNTLTSRDTSRVTLRSSLRIDHAFRRWRYDLLFTLWSTVFNIFVKMALVMAISRILT